MSIFTRLSDVEKFLIVSGIFIIALIVQHFYFRDKSKKDNVERDSLLTSYTDLDEH